MHACFIVLQLRSDSCQIHGYVMLCYVMLLTMTALPRIVWLTLQGKRPEYNIGVPLLEDSYGQI